MSYIIRRNTRNKKSAFVLVMTLALVLIAGVVMAAVARRSMLAAVDVQLQLENFQRKWAVSSCRDNLLPLTSEILEKAERGDNNDEKAGEYLNSPQPQLRKHCTLAGRSYELVLTDQLARANVNTLMEIHGKDYAASEIKSLLGDSGVDLGRSQVKIRQRKKGDSETKGKTGSISAFGQFLDSPLVGVLVGAGDECSPAVSDVLGCWGSGKVNIRRAPEVVIRSVCEKPLGRDLVAALLDIRDANPYKKLAAMVAELDLAGKQRKEKITDYLTDESDCYGLWIIARDEQRLWYNFCAGRLIESKSASGQDSDEYRTELLCEFGW